MIGTGSSSKANEGLVKSRETIQKCTWIIETTFCLSCHAISLAWYQNSLKSSLSHLQIQKSYKISLYIKGYFFYLFDLKTVQKSRRCDRQGRKLQRD